MRHVLSLAVVLCLSTGPLRADRPLPVGTSTVVVEHDVLGAGPVSFSGARDYSGLSPLDATNLGGAPNIGAFNADNILGRRSVVAQANSLAQSADETLMRHGVYKVDPNNAANIGDPFFANVDPDGDVTLRVEGIAFDRPVQIQEDTFLLHMLWNTDQADMAGQGFISPHSHRIVDNFRDLDLFIGPQPLPFQDSPANYALLDGIAPTFNFQDPTTFDMEITFPYALLQHLEDDGTGAAPGFPAPGGFIEPFHFHVEYLVVPEPASILFVAVGGLALCLRTRRDAPRR